MMPALLTTVPDVLTALTRLGQATVPGVAVYDGPPGDELPDEFLAVGFSRDEDEAAVDGSTADEGNGLSSESYDVHCILSCASGDAGPSAVADRRARAAQLWSAYASALRADPTLGGVLVAGARATVGAFSWIYGPSSQGGVYAEVEFDVTVSAGYLGAL